MSARVKAQQGHHSDANNLGLIYMNARYYMPQVGRFISPDTIVPGPGNPQSFNRYSYVRNNPMNFTDPTGHMESSGCDITDCTNGGTVNPNTYQAADGSSGISYAIPTLTQQPGQIIPTFHNPLPHLRDIASRVWSGITGD